MTQPLFWGKGLCVLAGMTVLFGVAASRETFGHANGPALPIIAFLSLVPFAFVNSWAQRPRQTTIAYPSILDHQISPVPMIFSATLVSFLAASCAAVIIPVLLSSLILQPDLFAGTGLAVFTLCLLPMLSKQKTAPSSQERSQ